MNRYSQFCDDFYINMNLTTEMDLPNGRETVLHYFRANSEEISDHAEVLLPREARLRAGGRQRSGATTAGRRSRAAALCSGHVNPPSIEAALEQHRLVLELGAVHAFGEPA